MLPERGWDTYEAALRFVAERRGLPEEAHLKFLITLGLVDAERDLTRLGDRYFQAAFIYGDQEVARGVLAEALLDYPPAVVITQLLSGVPDTDRRTAETVLRSQGFGEGLTDRKLGALLSLLNRAGVVCYSKHSGRIEVLVSPTEASRLPSSIFVSPETPYGNKAWLRRLLRRCESYVWWLDKHFQHVAFDELWEALNGRRVGNVRIISLSLPEHESKKVRKLYKDLHAELANRGIKLEWRTIASTHIRETHDRWIISGAGAWNVPNVNAIYSGQHCEMVRSENHSGLSELYKKYWELASPFE